MAFLAPIPGLLIPNKGVMFHTITSHMLKYLLSSTYPNLFQVKGGIHIHEVFLNYSWPLNNTGLRRESSIKRRAKKRPTVKFVLFPKHIRTNVTPIISYNLSFLHNIDQVLKFSHLFAYLFIICLPAQEVGALFTLFTSLSSVPRMVNIT